MASGTRVLRGFYYGLEGGIQPKHAAKLMDQLGVLDIVKTPEQMNIPGWQWHELKGTLTGHYAVSVNGNWRLTFMFDGEDAILVDYQDYH